MSRLIKVLFISSVFKVADDMKGIGYRVWELANVLAEEYQIDVLIPNNIDEKLNLIKHKNMKFVCISEFQSWELLLGHYDCVISEPYVNTNIPLCAYKMKKLFITDSLINPVEMLEMEKIIGASDRDVIFTKKLNDYKVQLFLSDYILTGSEEEKMIMYGVITGIGRLNYQNYLNDKKLDNLIGLLPIGYSEKFNEMNIFINNETLTQSYEFVWNGGLWNHYDPQKIIQALALLMRRGEKVNLVFMYSAVNSITSTARKALEDSRELGVFNKGVFFNEHPVYMSNRSMYFHDCRGIICVFPNSIESYTTYRLRFRDVLLFNVPIITNNYGLLGNIVSKHSIGMVLREDDSVEQIALKIIEFYDDTNNLKYRNNIKCIRNDYKYENTTQNLIRRINMNKLSPDKFTPIYESILDSIRDEDVSKLERRS